MSDEKWMPKDAVLVIVVFVFFLVLNFCNNNFKALLSGGRRTSSPRNQAQRRHFDVSVPNGTSLHLQTLGLECCVINSLPKFQFKKSEGRGGEQKTINAECAICLGEFEDGEWLKHLPNCNHDFHICCIDKWFQSHSNCPLCRSHVHCVANQEYSVSSHTLLETLRRENYSLDWNTHSQSFRSEILQSLAIRQQSSHDY